MSKKLTEILDQREDDYGDVFTNFTAIGRSWGSQLKIEDIPPYEVALMMAQLKIHRIIANPYKEDSWLDLQGYLHHAQNLIPKKESE